MNYWLDYSVIGIYFAVILAIGFRVSHKGGDATEYLLGGRRMPAWAIGLSCMVSLLSSVSIVMVPGEIFNNGLTLFIFQGTIGLALSIPCYLLFTRFYFKLGSFTPYEYLEYRYDPTVRAVVAVSAFYSRVMYLGMVLYTTAKIFESSYGWSPWFSILLVGLVGAGYTVMGGAKAVIWTDVLQFFFLFGGFIVIVVFICLKIDGGAWEAIACTFRTGHGIPQFSEPDFYSASPYIRLLIWLLLWHAVMAPLTTACSDQLNIQRLLSTRDWQTGFKSQIIATVAAMLFTWLLWFAGMAIYTYYQQNPDPTLLNRQGDRAFFHFVSTQLPSPLPGLFMAAMLAAIMSTLDSGMNAMATVWLKEIHQKFINRALKPEREVYILKWATLLIGVFAMGLGMLLEVSGKWLQQSVSEVGTLFYMIGAAILPAFLFAVLSPRANARLIWGYSFFAFGETIAMNIWYTLSRSSLQAFENGTATTWGWAGKLGFNDVLMPLLAALVLALPWIFRSVRQRWYGKLSALLSLGMFGAAEGMLIWYIYSNWMIQDAPMARSFNFGPPISFLIAFAILWLCPKQPREKYQGLTLATLGEPIIGMENKEKEQ